MGHEALADARRVGRELRRLGVERRIVSQPRAKTGWDSLTDSELKVVNLIAQGATNRIGRHAATPFPPHGENPRPQCVRQARASTPAPNWRSSCASLIDRPQTPVRLALHHIRADARSPIGPPGGALARHHAPRIDELVASFEKRPSVVIN